MEMRDSLIDHKEYAKQMRENAVMDENGIIRVSIELWEQIADIIERAIVPPCKVGDDIYRVGKGEIWEWQIAMAYIYPDETIYVDDSENKFTAEDIGKTVFLTKEEAEKALKGRGDNG